MRQPDELRYKKKKIEKNKRVLVGYKYLVTFMIIIPHRKNSIT